MAREYLNWEETDEIEEIISPLTEIIRRYDNFQLLDEAAFDKERAEKQGKSVLMMKIEQMLMAKNFKLGKKILVYSLLFIGVSAFKMHALYNILDLNMRLSELDKKIQESTAVVNGLEASNIVEIDISELKKKSKNMGFTDSGNIEYISVN